MYIIVFEMSFLCTKNQYVLDFLKTAGNAFFFDFFSTE